MVTALTALLLLLTVVESTGSMAVILMLRKLRKGFTVARLPLMVKTPLTESSTETTKPEK